MKATSPMFDFERLKVFLQHKQQHGKGSPLKNVWPPSPESYDVLQQHKEEQMKGSPLKRKWVDDGDCSSSDEDGESKRCCKRSRRSDASWSADDDDESVVWEDCLPKHLVGNIRPEAINLDTEVHIQDSEQMTIPLRGRPVTKDGLMLGITMCACCEGPLCAKLSDQVHDFGPRGNSNKHSNTGSEETVRGIIAPPKRKGSGSEIESTRLPSEKSLSWTRYMQNLRREAKERREETLRENWVNGTAKEDLERMMRHIKGKNALQTDLRPAARRFEQLPLLSDSL